MKITESKLKSLIKKAINEAMGGSLSMVQAVMNACGVDEKEAEQYIDNAAQEASYYMDDQREFYRVMQEEMRNIGLDMDYTMEFAQRCMLFAPNKEEEADYMTEDELYEELENKYADAFVPLKLLTDRRNSIIEFYYENINRVDKKLQYDVVRAYKRLKKELPKELPIKIEEPYISDSMNGSQTFIAFADYDEQAAKEGDYLFEDIQSLYWTRVDISSLTDDFDFCETLDKIENREEYKNICDYLNDKEKEMYVAVGYKITEDELGEGIDIYKINSEDYNRVQDIIKAIPTQNKQLIKYGLITLEKTVNNITPEYIRDNIL